MGVDPREILTKAQLVEAPRGVRSRVQLVAALQKLRDGRTVGEMNAVLRRNGYDRLSDQQASDINSGRLPKLKFRAVKLWILGCGLPAGALPAWEAVWRRVMALPEEGRAPSAHAAYLLGVHPSISTDDPELANTLTTYVPRACDAQLTQALRAAAEATGPVIVMVVGGSSTGKTRACLEALYSPPARGWDLIHPATADELAAILNAKNGDELRDGTLLWLNEAQFYFDPSSPAAGRIVAQLRDLGDRAERVVVLGSMWQTYWDRLTAVTDQQPRSPIGELLAAAAARVWMPDGFSPAEREALRLVALDDPRLAIAADTAGVDGLVIQTLAGGPQLVERYSDWGQSREPGAKAAWAVLTAALDARRMGWTKPLSDSLLKSAAEIYLAAIGATDQPDDWYEQATCVVTSNTRSARPSVRDRIRGISALDPVARYIVGPTDRYKVHDYLFQYASQRRLNTPVPRALWPLIASQEPNAEDASRLTRSAALRMIWWSHPVDRESAPDIGGIQTLHRLGTAASGLSDLPILLHWLADFLAGSGEAEVLRWSGARSTVAAHAFGYFLIENLADRGDIDGLRRLANGRRGAAAAFRLVDMLANRGEVDELRQRATDGADVAATSRLVDLLVHRGEVDELRRWANGGDTDAEQWLAVSADYGGLDKLRRGPYFIGRLADLLVAHGELEELRRWTRGGNAHAASRLADLLADRGELDELRRWADAGVWSAISRLVRVLADRGELDELRRWADAGGHYAASRLADLLVARGEWAEFRERAEMGQFHDFLPFFQQVVNGPIRARSPGPRARRG